jgi:hypothetical protein
LGNPPIRFLLIGLPAVPTSPSGEGFKVAAVIERSS